MTARELRNRRRAEERKARKSQLKTDAFEGQPLSRVGPQSHPSSAPPSPDLIAPTSPRSRADVNRANSQHSTGPSSSAGKARSAQNSFKHGLYSKQLILPGEDPAAFDELRASLRLEHQPANTTEEILVDELAQSFWRMRRFRELEVHAWSPELLSGSMDNGMMTLIARSMASAERSFHKSLTALQKLQRSRGFVPQKPVEEQTTAQETGFVPAESSTTATEEPAPAGFVPQKTAAEMEAFEYMGYFPEDIEKYVESIVNSSDHLPDNAEAAA